MDRLGTWEIAGAMAVRMMTAIRFQNTALALGILLALATGYRPAVAQNFTEFPLPTADSQPISITTGPDGALWFTEYIRGKIGRITNAGVITEFPLPNGNSPYSITTGPDGALWFTINGGGIGRISTAGVITEFLSSGSTWGITTGPDGALWFTENQIYKIGRITTAGVLTEFPIRTTNSVPQGITAGPDGALWFVEHDADQIARITTAGVVTEFPILTPIGHPWDITAEPDGALWFTEADGNKIGRITTAGVVTESRLRLTWLTATHKASHWGRMAHCGSQMPSGTASSGTTVTQQPQQ
jgi:streptogramin lyase